MHNHPIAQYLPWLGRERAPSHTACTTTTFCWLQSKLHRGQPQLDPSTYSTTPPTLNPNHTHHQIDLDLVAQLRRTTASHHYLPPPAHTHPRAAYTHTHTHTHACTLPFHARKQLSHLKWPTDPTIAEVAVELAILVEAGVAAAVAEAAAVMAKRAALPRSARSPRRRTSSTWASTWTRRSQSSSMEDAKVCQIPCQSHWQCPENHFPQAVLHW